jgi:hypothetical protein
MAPRNVSKEQAEHAEAGEDGESEQETLDPKAISKDMEKNVRLSCLRIATISTTLLRLRY